MPEQTARGLRYPTTAEAPSFPDDFGRLAGDIDALLPRVVTGLVWVTPRPNQPTTTRVTFPEGLFSSGTDRPQVLVGANTSVPGSRVELASYSNLTPSAVDLVVRRSDNVRTILMYAAVQNGGGAAATGWQRPQYDGQANTTARPSRYLDSLQAAVLAGMMRVETGTVLFNPVANQVTTERVAFGSGFAGPPVVLTSVESAWPYSSIRGSSASSISATGANINVFRTGDFPTNVNWVAFRPTATGRLWTPGGPANLPDLLGEFATNVEQRTPRIDSGVVPITPRPNTPTAVRVEFTPGRFTRVPRILVTANTAVSAVRAVTFQNATATGADVWINRTDSTETWLRWFAIEE